MRIARIFGLIAALWLIAGQTSADSALTALETGDDTRPYRAVGKLEMGEGRFCTATLISERTVLTAAHCVTDATGAVMGPEEVRFLAGWRDGRAEAYRGARRIAVAPGYAGDSTALSMLARDVALVELDLPVDGSLIDPIRPGTGIGLDVGVVSYGKGRSERPSLQETCRILGHQEGAVILSCAADYGTSGAPVLSLLDGELRIVSVVSAMADMGPDRVSIGADLAAQMPALTARLAEGDGVFFRTAPEVRRLSADEARSGGAAKFVRP